jgi:hypothetical protein
MKLTESPVTKVQPLPKQGRVLVSSLLHQMQETNHAREFTDVVSDILEKLRAGEEKYGSPLMTHNGRSADLDAYQDLLDAIAYMTQKVFETPEVDKVLAIIDDVDSLYVVASHCRKRLVKEGIL